MPPPFGRGWAARNAGRDFSLLASDDAEAAVRARASARRLLGLAAGEGCTLAAASVALLAASLCQVAVPHLAGQLLDLAVHAGGDVPPAEARSAVDGLLLQVVAVVVVGGAAGGLRQWLFQGAAERVLFRLRVRLFGRLLTQEIGFYDRARVGELTNRLVEDTRLLKMVATSAISMALRSATVTALGLAMMLATSPVLTGLVLLVLPPLLGSAVLYGRASKAYVAAQLEASAQASSLAEETLGNIRTVRSFAKEPARLESYRGVQRSALRCGLRGAALDGFFSAFNGSLATGSTMLVLWYGARLVLAGELTAGALSSFVVYAVFVAANAGMLMSVFSSIMQAAGAAERVFELEDREPALVADGTLEPAGPSEGARLAVRAVWFAYPSRPEAWVLQGFDLSAEPGTRVALVGPSGQGKSTVVALVQRWYDPQRGGLWLDGVPLPLLRYEFLHTQVALVSQEPVLFADTIYNNITFGCRGPVTMQQVEAAAKVANAHDFICSFPSGYDTTVGERGVRLSGGQKQRVAIARAVIVNPRLLLLDEATSALDAQAEHAVQTALDGAMEGRTVLLVAHRLSTVQSADRVAVVASGAVAECGTHAALLAAGGAYAALVQRQLLGAGAAGAADQREGPAEAAPGVAPAAPADGTAAAADGTAAARQRPPELL